MLEKNASPPVGDTLGTGNWSVPPKAILFGGAFGRPKLDEVRKWVADARGEARRRIPWIRVDSTLSKKDPRVDPEGYAVEVASRFKAQLARLNEEGKLERDGDDSMYDV